MAENIDKILKKYNREIKRHMSVLTEDFKDKVKLVSEQVSFNTEKIDGVQKDINEIKESVSRLRDDNAIIKMDLGIIKNHLKKKVDYDEFTLLEQRVSVLEAKVKR